MIKKNIESIFERLGISIMKSSTLKTSYVFSKSFNPLKNLFYKNLHNDFFFVQIGANDGVSFDPIYEMVTKEKVCGIAIEPVSDIFKKLQENYASNPQVKLLNCAIHKSEEEMTLYRVNPDKKNYPKWTQGTPSFNKNHHKLAGIPEEDIIEEKVKCLSFEKLVENYDIHHIDLLQIDTEGYDFEIIKMINFNKLSPKIISFEHGLRQGINTLKNFQTIQELLYKEGYNIIILENDGIAYKF